MLRQGFEMKAVLTFAVIDCILFFCCLQQFGLAAPTVEAGEDLAAVSSDIKRDAKSRMHCLVYMLAV